ncbi:MAG TPA: OB-fold nucleic acid binding domain-containing protein, partial [Terracidiphilus sp.]|nr:OB-fold nucleic acid binding domain-containing protein [Terracidiphilus sp.]
MKDIYIADLAAFDDGKLFDGFFLVLARQQRLTKTNKPYLNLILGDKTGQLEGRIWEPGDPRIAKDFDKGDIVKARGSASSFDGRIQMKIDQLRLAQTAEVDKSDLLPSTTYDVAALWSQLQASIESMANPDLKRLCQTMLADPAIAAAYREAPAARQLHHA